MDLVPLKSLWESASSSDASSTTLRPPPIRRGVLAKEGSFPRLKEKRLRSERRVYLTRARAGQDRCEAQCGCGSDTEFTGNALVTGKHASSLCNSFFTPGWGKWVWFMAAKPSTEKNMAALNWCKGQGWFAFFSLLKSHICLSGRSEN